MKLDTGVLANTNGPFKWRQRLVVYSLTKVGYANAEIGKHQGSRVRHCLGNLQPFCANGNGLSEPPHLSKTPGQIALGED